MSELITMSLFVWLKVMLLGWAWVWLVPWGLLDDDKRWKRWLFSGAAVGAIGILLTSLNALILGELGLFSERNEGLSRAVIFAAGIGIGFYTSRGDLIASLRQAMPASLVLLAGTVAIMAYPDRSEWIVGGWDPGVYMNEGNALSRTGTFYPPDAVFYDAFTADQQENLTRSGFGRTERFPGVLINPEKKSFTFELFRLTPALFGSMHRSGGLHAATRTNLVLAMVLAVCFTALIARHFSGVHAFFGALLLLIQPITIYHANLPTTEMLQTLLLVGFLFLVVGQRVHWRVTLFGSLFLAGAILNRFAFLPFAGLLMICLAAGHAGTHARGRVLIQHLMFVAVCAAAAWIDFRIAPASLRGWADINVILWVPAVAAAIAIGCDLLFTLRPARRLVISRTNTGTVWFGLLLVAACIASWFLRLKYVDPQDHDNLVRLVAFTGYGPLALAGLGALVMFLRPKIKAPTLYPLVLFLFAIAWLMILKKSIFDIYPWALRRYVPYLVPFIALSCGYVLARMWTLRSPAGKIAAAALLAVLIVEPIDASRRAWIYTEFRGVSAVLNEIANQVGPDDVMIADHPDWATPLALTYGIPTLNGREFWKDHTGQRMRTVLPALQQLASQGRRILFLTSTSSGMNIYPVKLPAESVWAAPRVRLQRINQHARASEFSLTTSDQRFELWAVEL